MMKDYKKELENKQKLIKFMNNSENRMLTVCFFTLVSYLILSFITKNSFVLLFGYFVLYFLFSKLYVHLYKKLVDSFTVENAEHGNIENAAQNTNEANKSNSFSQYSK